MYLYHIVAELRQFRGAPTAADRRIHSSGGACRDLIGQQSYRLWTELDKGTGIVIRERG
ncbi:hypothetical protein [Bradyrhizobium sp. CCBAU 65884]|uniref:hypothetical protein n=1 Tax=Bradyrhizobium sp. CCBAU 65884 TaxID=722477 RepID=UPI0023062EB4|nr:hypothetical protein [Bradyrhizobium sp. CCBAU 65884]